MSTATDTKLIGRGDPNSFGLAQHVSWTPGNILRLPFVDDAALHHGFGVTRAEVEEFVSIYYRMDPYERPTLSPFFDVRWYLDMNRDVAESGIDAFEHFCRFGLTENRSPHPLVSVRHLNCELLPRSAGHARMHRLRRLRKVIEDDLAAPSAYFDLEHYRGASDYKPDGRGALRHFLAKPDDQVTIPNRFFDPAFYSARYADAPGSPRAAFLHFVGLGDNQGRFPSALFDPEWYIRANPDVGAQGMPPLEHFLTHGRHEGRPPFGRHMLASTSRPAAGIGTFTPDLAGTRDCYERMRIRMDDRRRNRIHSFTERDVRPVVADDLDAMIDALAFPQSDRPRVSILVPFYDQLRLTVECLASVMRSGTRTSYEVFAADDCSPDPATTRLGDVAGLSYRRSPANLNFLLNCNDAFGALRGEYVLLLNNDAQLCPGAIDSLVAALDADPGLGAVGPQILFPSGRLQEAGCSINADATSVMVGVTENPDQPGYNYARDVHYVSGAALMFRRALAREDLFDPGLAPAYCEDLDLCLDMRARGHRIRYVPEAKVVHHLSVTMSDHGRKLRQIRVNQQRVFEKWTDELASMSRVRVLCFFLPQFHPIPENNLWWGDGFTEWTNVTKAAPSYDGHYQPHLPADLGFYDLRLPDVYRKQAALMARYGLSGLCLYYYNFDGRPFLNRPLDIILAHPDIALPFCLCWANENWTRRWDGGEHDILLEQSYTDDTLDALARDVARAAQDPRYIRVGARPVVLIYRPLLIPDATGATVRLRRAAAEAGLADLHLVFVESMEAITSGVNPLDLGFDASVEFPPQGIAAPMTDSPVFHKPDWKGARYDYEETVANAVMRPSVPWPRYPAAFPSWDNTARRPSTGTSFDRASPEAFQVYLEEKIEQAKAMFVGDSRFVFVNAWNEWAEGAHLEPDRAYGHRWLEAVSHALDATSAR